MTALTLIPSFASNQDLNNKGTSLPPWNASSRSAIASLVSNTSKWWSDSHSDVFYSIQNVGNNFDVEFQYGQNLQVWASAKFIKYSYIISNEVINADNSITFDLTISFLGVVSNKTSYANAGVSVQNRMYMGSQIIMSRDGNTIDNYQISINSDNPITFKNITLAPRASFNAAQLQWGSTYPNHEYPNATINIGMLIFNPLYAWYVPMITRKNSAWLPLNGNAGKILIRVNHYIAYANSADGTNGFTTVYPNLNLLDGTKDFSGNWVNPSIWTNDGTYKGLTVKKRTAQWGGIYKTFTAPKDGTYTFSAYIKSSGNMANVYRYVTVNGANPGTIVPNKLIGNNFDWLRDSFNVTLKAGDTIYANYAISGVGTDSILWTAGHKWESGSTATPWMPSASEVKPSDYPSYYGSYYGQGNQSQNASDYSWSPMISPIPQTNMGWSDFSIETQGTENQANKGHNRRRTAGQFLQLPKLN